MLVADLVFTTEEVAFMAAITGSLVSAIGVLFYKLLEALKEERNNWKQLALEGAEALEKAVELQRRQSGEKPFTRIAPVVPEHSSPSNKRQRSAAELQTARARVVAAKLDLGIEARDERKDSK